MSTGVDLTKWAPSIEPYADWIHADNPAEAKLWLQELRVGSPEQQEARAAEAVAWDWIYHRVDEVHSVRSTRGPSPDFHCRVGRSKFFIEVSNISRAAMTEITGMPDVEIFAGNYGSPADRLHHAILVKEAQGRSVGAPYLVLVTTLHWNGSRLLEDRRHLEMVLRSRQFIQGYLDAQGGEIVAPEQIVTDFKRAAFTRSKSLNKARAHVSGAIFGPFGHYPDFRVNGILNPDAKFRFDPSWLPDVPFGRFERWPPTAREPEVRVVWRDNVD